MTAAPPRLILASASTARRRLLAAAGVTFSVRPAVVDETAVKRERCHEGAAVIARILAEQKALAVATAVPDALVIGADQMLVCAGRSFDKPATREAATATLHALQGREHRLLTAVALARGGAVLWRHDDVARLVMRGLDGATIEAYLARLGAAALDSVGAYQVEGIGSQLFERIEGDLFAVQGLPLLPLLGALRRHGGMP